MTYIMQLNDEPFRLVREGIKTIELRLNDEKRRRIRVGDCITFLNRDNASESLTARVIALHPFESFDALYAALPLDKCGYTAETIGAASPRDMDTYYSAEDLEKHGVVGLEIEPV
ncbi:MAG: ASCH domain-containing protein [Clostridia bacterium]|nr:ASCH domain-containing protein [Clostridia bacterium]